MQKLKTLKYKKIFPSGSSIEVRTEDPNNDFDLPSYELTTKNGNGSAQTIRLHELEGITLDSKDAEVNLKGYLAVVLQSFNESVALITNGGATTIKAFSDGRIEFTTIQDSGSQEAKLTLNEGKLTIFLGDQGLGGTELKLDVNSLQTLKTLLGL